MMTKILVFDQPTVAVMQHVPFPYIFLNYDRVVKYANTHTQTLFDQTLIELVNQPFDSLCSLSAEDLIFNLSASGSARAHATNVLLNISTTQEQTVQMRVVSEIGSDSQFKGYHVFLDNSDPVDETEGTRAVAHAIFDLFQAEQFTHEFMQLLKTPLSTLSTSLYILRHRKDRLEEHLERMQQQLYYLVNVVNDSHLYMNTQRYQPVISGSEIFLEALVTEQIQLFEHRFLDKGITMSYLAPAMPIEIKGYRSWLNVLVATILENALHFTESGQVSVSVQGDYERHLAYVVVQDFGLGIKGDELPHIFDPFFKGTSNPPDDERSGLGLAIARRIVDQHGGQILVNSAAGKGTTVTVILPLIAE